MYTTKFNLINIYGISLYSISYHWMLVKNVQLPETLTCVIITKTLMSCLPLSVPLDKQKNNCISKEFF